MVHSDQVAATNQGHTAPFQPVPGMPAWRDVWAWGVCGMLQGRGHHSGFRQAPGKGGEQCGPVRSLWVLPSLATLRSPPLTPRACTSALKLLSLWSAMRPATMISEPS